MPRGKVELTPAKKLAKAADMLGLSVVELFTILSLGKEATVNDEGVRADYGNLFVNKVGNWNFLEGCK